MIITGLIQDRASVLSLCVGSNLSSARSGYVTLGKLHDPSEPLCSSSAKEEGNTCLTGPSRDGGLSEMVDMKCVACAQHLVIAGIQL